jgi:DNA polymerase III alpha subunit
MVAMIDLGDRQILADGTVILRPQGAVEALYAGGDISVALLTDGDDVRLHNHAVRLLDSALGRLDTQLQTHGQQQDWRATWLTPEPWSSMDMTEFCMQRCATEAEMERACEELLLFDQRGMWPVLRHLAWMVHDMRSRGIVWGVGRGSSVSSFVLYLIGINRINPLQYDLDISEFLR